MTTITHEYKVYDRQGFIDTLNTIVRRYKAEVVLHWGEPVTSKIRVGGYSPWSGEYIDREVNITQYPVAVDFNFDEFKIEGYQYLGCIKDELMMGLITIHGNEALEGRDATTFVNSFQTIPCHACNRNHKRKVGHLFLEESSNEIRVFGSSCAKKYFGINFDRLLNFFERINLSFGDGWEEGFLRGYRDKTIHWKSAARYAYYWIQKHGYLSGTKAKEREMNSTGDWVRELYNGNDHVLTEEVKRELKDMEFPEMDILTTNDFLNGKTEDLNDFEHNLLVLQEKMKLDVVTYHSYGWLAFLVYRQFFYTPESRPERVEYVIPEWATPKYRVKKGDMETVAEVSHIHSFNGSWGLTYIYTFICGNVRYKWFTSNDQNVEVGDVVNLVAFTVKDTEDNQYGKAVIITRVNLSKGGEPTRTPSTSPKKVYVSKEDREYFERMGIDTNNTWIA